MLWKHARTKLCDIWICTSKDNGLRGKSFFKIPSDEANQRRDYMLVKDFRGDQICKFDNPLPQKISE